MMRDKLTILLTLKGRPRFTFRWLDYMERMRCPYRILISDGGADPEVEERLSSGREYKGLRYTYLRFPYDATHTEYYNKLRDSAEHIKTPFVYLADNDDFVLFNALERSAVFLDGNPQYSSCGGAPIFFTVRNMHAKEREDLLYGQRVTLGMGPQGPNIEHKHPGDRVRAALDDYFSFGYWYNVHRTKTVQRFYDELARVDFEKYIFAECLFSAFLAHDGMIRHDAQPFYVRQLDTSMDACNDGQGTNDLLLMSLYPFWGKDVQNFVTAARSLAGEQPEETPAEAEDAFRERLARQLYRTYEHTLRPAPTYRRLADRLGLRQSLPWRLSRKAFLAAQAAVRHYDLLGRGHAETARILAKNPEMKDVLRFLSQRPAADDAPQHNHGSDPA